MSISAGLGGLVILIVLIVIVRAGSHLHNARRAGPKDPARNWLAEDNAARPEQDGPMTDRSNEDNAD
jgi:hypothetical protein